MKDWYKEVDIDIVSTNVEWLEKDYCKGKNIKADALDFLERINITDEIKEAIDYISKQESNDEIIEVINCLTYEDIPCSEKEYREYIANKGE